VGKAIKSNIKKAFQTIKTIAKGKRPVTEVEILGRVKDPTILERPNATLDDMKEALGPDTTDEDAQSLFYFYKSVHGIVAEEEDDEEEEPIGSKRQSTKQSGSTVELTTLAQGSSQDVAILRQEVHELNQKLDRLLEHFNNSRNKNA